MTVAVHDVTAPVEEPAEGADRSLPSDVASERSMLAAVLFAGSQDTASAHRMVDELAAIVEPGELWIPAHETIWAAMVDAAALGTPLDAASVAGRLGGAAVHVLPQLVTLQTPAGAAEHHARRIAAAAVARRVIAAGTQAVQRGYAREFDPDLDVPAIVERLEQAAARQQTPAGKPIAAVMEHAVDLIETPEKIDVIPSGLHELDMIYGGLRPGQLVVVAARPSVGKSTFAHGICEQAAVRTQPGRLTVLFTMEMDATAVTHRMLASRSGVELSKILTGNVDEDDWHRLGRHMRPLADAPLVIDDSSTITVGHIRAQVRRLARKGLGLVVIDYLGLIQMPRAEKRQEAVADCVRDLKRLAGEVQVPILLLAQLNRGSELRSDKRPVLSDLRESGEIEQSADVVMLLHRPDMYNPDDRPGEADVHVAKHRNGMTGTAPVAFRGHYARFDSMTGWAEM